VNKRTCNLLSRAARIESLERRMLLSLSPAGAEFRVNTFTTSDQSIPAIASDSDGDFVVAWDSFVQDGSGRGIYAQRYNAAGVALGGEFRANTFTAGDQRFPAVAMDADGDFVIAWDSAGQDGSLTGIYAQRYNAAGVAQGGEFRVNAFTTGEQLLPQVSMDASGNFAIAWQGNGSGDTYGVYARRYDAAGRAQGDQFLVNTSTTGSQRNGRAAMDASGDFVVAWSGEGVGDIGGIFAQRYNALGVPQGGEFRANTVTTGTQSAPSVAMDASGDFVVAWTGVYDIFAQRYDAAGVAQGGEFRVNTVATGFQTGAAAAMDANGNFLIAWSDAPTFSGTGEAMARSFTADGVGLPDFLVNTFTTSIQDIPRVALDADGNTVIAWRSFDQDGSGEGIYAQRYSEADPDTSAPMVGGVSATQSSLVLSFSEQMSVAGGSSGSTSATNKANYRLSRNGVDISSQINFATFSLNSATRKFEATLFFSTVLSNGSYVVTARATLRDTSNNALDGNFDGVAGGDFTGAFALTFPQSVGPEFRVNTFTTGDQNSPQSAADANGDFVVAWVSRPDPVGQPFENDIYAQRYNVDGVAQGPEFRVNDFTTGSQFLSSVAMDADGDFVVTWDGQGPSDFIGVFARRFNAAGIPQGGDFRVSETTGFRESPSVAMADDGDFVVAWESHRSNPSGYEVYARRFNAAGVALSGEFRVDQTTSPTKKLPVVAADAAGGFLVAWSTRDQDGDGIGVFARRFNATGAPLTNEFRVDTTTAGNQLFPQVAMDADGDAVVAWKSGSGSVYGEFAQRYDPAGTAQGGEFQVNQTTLNQFATGPSLAMDDGGDFVVTWGQGDVLARRYVAAGAPQAGEFRVNTFTNDTQSNPTVAMDADGDRFVIAWGSRGSPPQDGSGYGVFAQRYARVPEVNISDFLFQTAPHRLQFTFNDNVSASLGTNDIVLENLTTGQTIPSSQLTLSYDGGTNTATFSYTGNGSGITGVLPDGNYRATLLAAGITNPGGTPLAANHVFNFFFLRGDANHDATVNLLDFNILASNFGQSPRNFSQGDFNYDTVVNLLDFNILAGRFGVALSPAAFGRRTIRETTGGDNLGEYLTEASSLGA
jgi:hypothetical protein